MTDRMYKELLEYYEMEQYVRFVNHGKMEKYVRLGIYTIQVETLGAV